MSGEKLKPKPVLLGFAAVVAVGVIALIVALAAHGGPDTTARPVDENTELALSSATAAPHRASITAPTPQPLTAGCVAHGNLPDPRCTPGATISTATVAQICVPGYSKGVRNVPQAEKDAVFAAYGITTHAPGQYEVDHLISLELGGSNDQANLWPEAAVNADGSPGFHVKDRVENEAHAAVCGGTLSLTDAQHEIATDWIALMHQLEAR